MCARLFIKQAYQHTIREFFIRSIQLTMCVNNAVLLAAYYLLATMCQHRQVFLQ